MVSPHENIAAFGDHNLISIPMELQKGEMNLKENSVDWIEEICFTTFHFLSNIEDSGIMGMLVLLLSHEYLEIHFLSV